MVSVLKSNKTKLIFLGGIAIILAFLAIYVKVIILIIGLLAIIILFLSYRYQWLLFYLMILFYPFIYWEFVYQEINVPYVDLIGLLLLLSSILGLIFKQLTKPKIQKIDYFLVAFYFLFLLSAGLSLINAEYINVSLKYFFRPIAFFIPVFVGLPLIFIRERKVIKNVIIILAILGLVVSIYGLLGLVANIHLKPFPRVQPLVIAGFSPIGYNHNIIAEILLTCFPAALILQQLSHNNYYRRFAFIIAILIAATIILTLSRAGWICLFLEILIILFFNYRQQIKAHSRRLALALIFLLPLVYLMLIFNLSFVAESSNLNRLHLNQIAWDMFKRHPFIGQGVGSFISVVGQDKFYILDYGAPLDAHGIIQKIAAEQGVFGLVTYGGLLIIIFYYIFRTFRRGNSNTSLMVYFIALTLGILVFELFNTSYYISKFWLPLGLSFASVRLLSQQKSEE